MTYVTNIYSYIIINASLIYFFKKLKKLIIKDCQPFANHLPPIISTAIFFFIFIFGSKYFHYRYYFKGCLAIELLLK